MFTLMTKAPACLHAEADKLLVSIEALEEEHLDQLEGVVENHLVRMAKDEELIVVAKLSAFRRHAFRC